VITIIISSLIKVQSFDYYTHAENDISSFPHYQFKNNVILRQSRRISNVTI
jgi:hypothetical protein